jgi:hypothetical protein
MVIRGQGKLDARKECGVFARPLRASSVHHPAITSAALIWVAVSSSLSVYGRHCSSSLHLFVPA